MHTISGRLSVLLLLAGLFLPGSPPPVPAELYKWVDEEGVTHYSERPPPDRSRVDTITVRTGSASESAIERMQEQVQTADELRKDRLQEQELQRQEKEAEAIRKENCRRARAKLAAYQIPNALIAQPDGSRIRVDEETRQRELASARELIGKYCN